MKPDRRSILSRLDDALRWTGIPARVADEMSEDPLVDPRHRPLRWIPIWPIAFSFTLFILFLAWPTVLDRVLLGGIVAAVTSLGVCIGGLLLVIHTQGPLGKPSWEDDEREATLRKDSFLFCFGLLACLNCLGGPFLLIVPRLEGWQTVHIASVAASAFMVNLTLFGSLPTLYASWNSQQLPKE